MLHEAEKIAPTNPTSSVQDIMNEMKRLRQAAGDHISNTAVDIADATAKKTAEYLMDTAIQRLQELCEQEEANKQVQSCLNTLMRRFNEKSTITEAIEWYGRKTILQKAGIGVIFVAGSALVGALFNLSALFTLLSIGIFCAAETLLTEHYELTENQRRELAQDIKQMELNLFDSVACLKEVSKKLDDVFLNLLQQSIQSAHLLKEFEKQTSTLDGKIHDFLSIMATLSETNTTLMRDHQHIHQQLERAHLEMERANATIATQSLSLDTVGLKLDETNHKLRERNDELAAIHTKFQGNLTTIGELEAAFKEELRVLKAESVSNEQPHAKKTDAIAPSVRRNIDDLKVFAKQNSDARKTIENIRLRQAIQKDPLKKIDAGEREKVTIPDDQSRCHAQHKM